MSSFLVRSELPVLIRVDPAADFSFLEIEPRNRSQIMSALEATKPPASYEIRGTYVRFVPTESIPCTAQSLRSFPDHQDWILNEQRDRGERVSVVDVSSWRRDWRVRRPTLWEALSSAVQMSVRVSEQMMDRPYPDYLRSFCDALVDEEGRPSYVYCAVGSSDRREYRHVALLPMERFGHPCEMGTGTSDRYLFVDETITPPLST